MLKRYFALLIMFMSYTIWVGHDVIPHHHHDSRDTAQHHSHDEDHEDGEGALNHILSLVQHSTDGFQFNNETVKKVDDKQTTLFLAYVALFNHLAIPPVEEPIVVPEESIPIYISQSRSCIGLRAPPFEIA